MKKIILSMALVAMVFCIGCKKDKEDKARNSGTQYDNTPVELTVTDMHYTECLNHVDPDPDKQKPADWDSVYINYFENSMEVNVHNFGVSCSLMYIKSRAEISNDTIYVSFEPFSDPLGPGCHCEVDVSCMVTEIPRGNYFIVVHKGDERYNDMYVFYRGRHTF